VVQVELSVCVCVYIPKRNFELNGLRHRPYIFYGLVVYTYSEVTSQNLGPRYDRHFVGITWHNVWS